MPAYSVYTKETGQITMSNLVFDDPEGRYARILSEREMSFIGHDTPSHARLDRDFVWRGELTARPYMQVTVDRTEIGVGESDGTTIRNVPRGAVLTILAGGIQFFSEEVSGSKIEISVPVPGIYDVHIHKWPYRDFNARIVAR